jgi:hypothetical protein
MSQCAIALIFNCRSTLCVPEFPPRSRLYGGPNLRRKNRSGRTMKPCAFAACTGRISRSATKVPPIAISVSTCSTNRPSWNRKPAGAWSAAFATPAAEFFGAGGPLQSVRSGFDLAAQASRELERQLGERHLAACRHSDSMRILVPLALSSNGYRFVGVGRCSKGAADAQVVVGLVILMGAIV